MIQLNLHLSSRQSCDWRAVLDASRTFNRTPRPKYDLRIYWRAQGYLAAASAAEPVLRAHGFASVLHHIEPVVLLADCIAGSTRGFYADSLPEYISEDDYARAVEAHTRKGQRSFGSGFDHTLADYRTLLSEGIPGIRQRCRRAAEIRRDAAAQACLEGMTVTLDALESFARRYAQACDAKQQTDCARRLQNLTQRPPQTFIEAVQLIWLTHIAFCSEGRRHMALGRLDQLLLPFYRDDTATGRLTDDRAREILCNLWSKIEELGEVTNICIGGLTPEGADATNELSYLMLDATRLVQSPHTNLSARFHDATPSAFHRACFECIRTGVGFPAIFNDHVLVPGLVRIGIPEAVARDHCMVGCIETMLAGRQPAWSDGRFNTPVYLCNALNQLRNEPRKSYQRLVDLFEDELAQGMHAYVARINATFASRPANAFPDPFLSALTRDCIARARDVNDGGAEFPRFHGVAIMGLATVADSLAAVRKLVFEEKAVDYDRLMEALDENFAGFEPLRQMLINRAPKYGNADPYVDDIAAQLVARAADACLQHTMPDGGRFVAAMAANITNIAAGREVPATPDGRFAGTPLSDAASPFFGRDRNGPTAFLASVATPDYSNVLTGSVVNMKFEPDCFAGKEGADRFEALTQHFVRDRIQQLQFNATGNETLLKARNRPGDFPNLVVRVSGFSAYFVNLAPEVQEDVIRRRAHRLIPSEASD